MTDQDEVQQATENARTTLQNILQLMGFEARIESHLGEAEGEVLFHVESNDAARLIGRGAQVLQALQFVLNRMLHRPEKPGPHFVVDVEHYRERQKGRVLNDALDAARRVEVGGAPVILPPMGSSERRIVHQALRDNPKVKTYSQPEDAQGMNCVVVCPADMEIPEVPARTPKIEVKQQPAEG